MNQNRRYTLCMPYRYLVRLMGREPDSIGDNQRYVNCKVNPTWHFDHYTVQSWDYDWFVNRDLEEPAIWPVREVGEHAVYEEDPEDVKINEHYEDGEVGNVIFYTVHILFGPGLSHEKKQQVLSDLLQKYVNLFRDPCMFLELERDKITLKSATGKYIRLIPYLTLP